MSRKVHSQMQHTTGHGELQTQRHGSGESAAWTECRRGGAHVRALQDVFVPELEKHLCTQEVAPQSLNI